jgi:hypothetical protein
MCFTKCDWRCRWTVYIRIAFNAHLLKINFVISYSKQSFTPSVSTGGFLLAKFLINFLHPNLIRTRTFVVVRKLKVYYQKKQATGSWLRYKQAMAHIGMLPEFQCSRHMAQKVVSPNLGSYSLSRDEKVSGIGDSLLYAA